MPSLQQGHAAGSWSRKGPPGPFLQSCFPVIWPPSLKQCPKMFLPRCSTASLPLLDFMEVHTVPFLQRRDGSTISWSISHSSSFMLSANLLRVASAPSLSSSVNTVSRSEPAWAPGYSTRYWHLAGPHARDNHPLSSAAQPVFNPPL